jgi:CDP-glucose 4,6-dehydratase
MKHKTIKNQFKGKKILITGNTGFVGSWLCIALYYFGANILGYSLKKKDKKFISNQKIFSKKIKTIYGDIKNFNKSSNIIKKFKPEIAIHLASQPLVLESYKNVKKTFITNVIGTVDFFETLQNISSIKKIIVFTSDKVYRNLNGEILSEKSPLGGIDPYSASKSSQDIVTTSFKSSVYKKKIEVTILRAGNIIGGGDWNKNRIVPDIFKSIFGKKQILLRNPNAVRPWQHILEIVNSFLLIIKKKNIISHNPQVFNIAPNLKSNIKVIQLTNLIKNIGGYKKFKIKYKKISQYESFILKLSSLSAKKKINYKPKLNLRNSIKLTCEWYNAFYNKKNMFNFTIKQIDSYLKFRI